MSNSNWINDSNHSYSVNNLFDPVDIYFECITTCSIDDGECILECVDELKTNGN